MESPFDILGVDAEADESEVVGAYRRRVKDAHPDHGGSVSEFQRIQAAYAAIQAGHDGDEPLDEAADGERDPETVAERHAPGPVRVEYLNYEILDDYRWSIDDDDLFEKAAAADLGAVDHGELEVEAHESLLEAAESCGLAWPYACRGGACANCAVTVLEGDLEIPVDHILPSEMMNRDIRLSCNGIPTTEEMKVVYNVKHLPDLDELRLPPGPFAKAYPNQ